MKTWNAFLRGEDGMEFTVSIEANSISEARKELEEDYPESYVQQVFDPVEREREIQDRVNRQFEDPDYLDDYDY